MRARLALASLIFGLIPGVGRAGDSVCWIENGVLLVPAIAAGVNGVFVLDTGAAQSQLDATQASEADIPGPVATGAVRLAGRTLDGVRMQVLELDDRTRAFPTPIAGVLGSDVLTGQVVQIRPDPCHLRTTRSHGARTRRAVAITLKQGVPYIRAGVSDGRTSRIDDLRIDTGAPRSVMLDAADPVTATGGRLRALSIGDTLFEDVPAAIRAGDGALGEPIWSRFTMRLDYAGKTLTLEPNRR